MIGVRRVDEGCGRHSRLAVAIMSVERLSWQVRTMQLVWIRVASRSSTTTLPSARSTRFHSR